MHDMTAKKDAITAITQHPNFAKYHKQFPTSAWMRREAPRNVPRFAFEYGDTGAGNDVGIEHNWSSFDNVTIVPRYGVTNTLPPVDVDLFGTRYAAPIGIAPMGGPSLVWPGADLLCARAAQRAHGRARRPGRGRCAAAAGRAGVAAAGDPQVDFEIVMLGNFALKSLALPATATATWRATAL